MLKNITILFMLSLLMLPTKNSFAKNYCAKTKDYQFVIYSSDKSLAQSSQEIASRFPTLLKTMLNTYFIWDMPALIYIHSPLDWNPQLPYKIKNVKDNRQIDLCATKDTETQGIFPAITNLLLGEIIKEEKNISRIKQTEKNIPLWLTEGLWRHAVQYNTPLKLKMLKNLNIKKLTRTNPDSLTPLEKDLFVIESAFLIEYLLYLPYGSIAMRKITAQTYKKKSKKHAKIIYRAYSDYFKDADDFDKKWNSYLEAKILSAQIS